MHSAGGMMSSLKKRVDTAAPDPDGAVLRQIMIPQEWHSVISYISSREGLKMWEVAARAFSTSNLKEWMKRLAPPDVPK